MATAALSALREAFPKAHITWAVGPWSARAIAHHPALDEILLTEADLPLSAPGLLWRFSRQLRAGNFDLAVSLVRSPLMSLATWLAGVPVRAGLDSGGRGFGYNLRAAIDPDLPQHESEIYLRVVSAAAGRDMHCYANLPVTSEARASVKKRLLESGISPKFIVAHPGGGLNPGMRFEGKRYPPKRFAELLDRLATETSADIILLGGPGDADLVAQVQLSLKARAASWVDQFSFVEIGALAAEARLYLGNDSGLTHLAAASGAKTVMLMGPTDPRRYAPYTRDSLALWQAAEIARGGAAQSSGSAWDWDADGISVDAAANEILAFLRA